MEITKKKMPFDVVLLQPPVEGRTGEALITIRNENQERELSVRHVVVREVTGGSSRESRRFAVIPAEEDGGYRGITVPAQGSKALSFCLRPLEAAEVGTSTAFDVEVVIGDTKLHESLTVQVEARPEVYAALGAVEWLREKMLTTYREMQQKGRETQRDRRMTWPSAEPADPVGVALGEESFRKVFEAIQLGARILDGIGRKSGSGSS